jgi:hypothetical protein
MDDIKNSKFLTSPGLELRPLDHPVTMPTALPWKVKISLQQAMEATLGCETSRIPHFLENQLTDGGEVALDKNIW